MTNFFVRADRAVKEIEPVIFTEANSFDEAYQAGLSLYKSAQYLGNVGFAKHVIQVQILNSNKEVVYRFGSI